MNDNLRRMERLSGPSSLDLNSSPHFFHHSDPRSEANYALAFRYICASDLFVGIVTDTHVDKRSLYTIWEFPLFFLLSADLR